MISSVLCHSCPNGGVLSTTTKVVRIVVTLLIFVYEVFFIFYSPRVNFLAYYIYGSSFSTHRECKFCSGEKYF